MYSKFAFLICCSHLRNRVFLPYCRTIIFLLQLMLADNHFKFSQSLAAISFSCTSHPSPHPCTPQLNLLPSYFPTSSASCLDLSLFLVDISLSSSQFSFPLFPTFLAKTMLFYLSKFYTTLQCKTEVPGGQIISFSSDNLKLMQGLFSQAKDRPAYLTK